MRFKEGVAFAKKEVWQKAYEAFLEAWKSKQHPQIALNLGRAELEIGKYRDAIEHLGYCVSHAEAGDPDAALARGWLTEAEKKVARLVITVDVAGAGVRVDDAVAGNAPLEGPVLVDPGKHVVQAALGERRVESAVSIETGASLKVELRLPAAGTATATARLPPGTAPGPATAPGAFPVRTVVLIGGGAGTLIGLGIGALMGGLSLQKQSEREGCSADPYGRDCAVRAEADRASLARGSLAGFVGGGLFAAGTAAYLIFGPKESKVVVAPAVSGAGVGLSVQGRF